MRRLVGRNVRRIRLERGLTQEVVSERTGFTQGYISELENGRRNPTVVTLFEIGQILGVNPEVLVAADDEARAEQDGRGKLNSSR
eukprot:gene19235-19620_t